MDTWTALKHSGSQFKLHTHSCVRVMNINRKVVFCSNVCQIKTILLIKRCVPCVTSAPSVTPLPVTPASPHVVETSLTSTFDDGLCVTVDVGLLFFLHDVVQTYIKENETTSSGACLRGYLLFVGIYLCLYMVHTVCS